MGSRRRREIAAIVWNTSFMASNRTIGMVSFPYHFSCRFKKEMPMASAPARILCIGRDKVLLDLCCAVLAYSGYEAQAAVVPEGYEKLRTGKFDLVIASVRLAEEFLPNHSSPQPMVLSISAPWQAHPSTSEALAPDRSRPTCSGLSFSRQYHTEDDHAEAIPEVHDLSK
jgi:hypothetical protein